MITRKHLKYALHIKEISSSVFASLGGHPFKYWADSFLLNFNYLAATIIFVYKMQTSKHLKYTH